MQARGGRLAALLRQRQRLGCITDLLGGHMQATHAVRRLRRNGMLATCIGIAVCTAAWATPRTPAWTTRARLHAPHRRAPATASCARFFTTEDVSEADAAFDLLFDGISLVPDQQARACDILVNL